MTQLTQFELPQEQPKLPQGDTNLPPVIEPPPFVHTYEKAVGTVPFGRASNIPPSYYVNTENMMDPVVSMEKLKPEIDLLPVDMQEIVRAWWPHCWFKNSPHIQGHPVCDVREVLIHAKAEGELQQKEARRVERDAAPVRRKEREQRTEKDIEYKKVHVAWENDCIARQNWIAAKIAEWRRRVQAKKLATAEFNAQWEAYVGEANAEMQAAKASAAPLRPVRT